MTGENSGNVRNVVKAESGQICICCIGSQKWGS